MSKCIENGVIRDAAPEEIEAWEAAANQPASPPGHQEQVMTLARAMAEAATTLTDAVALSIPDLLPTWEELLAAGTEIAAGVCLVCNGQTYRVVQSVVPQSHQAPDAEGMLAIYRPIDKGHTGTQSDPIPWVYGMDSYNGKYYSYDSKIYLCKSDMIHCVWAPGTAGLWQWEVVEG